MITSKTTIRVRYADTDQMGYVYYGKYAEYYEVGRVEALRELGLTYSEMESVYDVLMPVTRMECKYMKPAYYDNLLSLETTIVEKPNAFIKFETKIYNEDGDLLNIGKVQLAFIRKDGKRIRIPSILDNLLAPYYK